MKREISKMTLIVIFLLATTWAFAGQKEKIAVAANGETSGALISGQAGTAPYFLFFDEKGKFIEAMENPYKGKGGAGKAVADYLAGKGVTVVVAGGFGGPIVDVMKDKGIKATAFKGSADEAVKKVLQPK